VKNILVQFDIKAGEYEHRDFYLFKKKQSEYKYCKEFWGLTKKRELSENVFWDNQIQNTIEVYSETELTDQQTKTLKEVGVVF
jgi:hypothetical protein